MHFTISKDCRPHDFSEQLQAIAQQRNVAAIREYLSDRANTRNRFLYAAQEGAPRVTSLNNFLPKQRQNVFMIAVLFLMIDPYPKKQLFVQQALQAFLKMLDLLQGDIVFE